MALQGQASFSQKNSQTEHRLGGWRILMNYIQPNAGQTTHSIYTLIQDGAQYVPLKCRKARREFYWTKTGGWLRYLNVSRRITCTFLLSMLLWKSARVLVRGKQWMLHMHMFIVKHRLFNTLLRPFTRFNKNKYIFKVLLCVFKLTYENLVLFCRGISSFQSLKRFFYVQHFTGTCQAVF